MTFEEWTKQVKQAIKNKNKKQLDWLTAEWLVFVFAFAGSLGVFGCAYNCTNGARDFKCYVAPDACKSVPPGLQIRFYNWIHEDDGTTCEAIGDCDICISNAPQCAEPDLGHKANDIDGRTCVCMVRTL